MQAKNFEKCFFLVNYLISSQNKIHENDVTSGKILFLFNNEVEYRK